MLSFHQAAVRGHINEFPRAAREARERFEECTTYIAEGLDDYGLGRCKHLLI